MVLDVTYRKVYIVCFIELVAPETYPLIKEEKRFNFKKIFYIKNNMKKYSTKILPKKISI